MPLSRPETTTDLETGATEPEGIPVHVLPSLVLYSTV